MKNTELKYPDIIKRINLLNSDYEKHEYISSLILSNNFEENDNKSSETVLEIDCIAELLKFFIELEEIKVKI